MTSEEIRTAAVGRLFRGLAHELANSFNNVTMNTELARLSPEDCADALDTVARNARSGGQLLNQFSSFAGAADFKPVATCGLAEALTLTQRLISSRARRANLQLTFNAPSGLQLPLDSTGLTVTLALLIDSMCGQASAITVEGIAADDHCEISLCHDGDAEFDSVSRKLANMFTADHGGQIDDADDQLKIILPLR